MLGNFVAVITLSALIFFLPFRPLMPTELLPRLQIYVWSIKTGRLLDILSGHEGPVSCLAFSPLEGGLLASGSWDKTARCGSVAGKCGHRGPVSCLAFSPLEGGQLASVCGKCEH